MTSLLPILILTVVVLGFGAVMLFLASLGGPKKPRDKVKEMPYECGLPGEETKESKVSVKFYLTAILFIIFDIEIIFMYPWAISFNDFLKKGEGLYTLVGMGVFILLFIVGLVWEVKSKALEWD